MSAIQNLSPSNFNTTIDGAVITATWTPSGTAGNGQTITTSSADISTTNFSGGTNTVSTLTPTGEVVSGNTSTLTFTEDLNLSDELNITLVNSTSGETYSQSGIALTTTEDLNPIVPVNQEFSDYIDEGNCFYKKTYRRDEVYSFGVVLLFKDGSTSQAFHIPGYEKSYSGNGRDASHTFTRGNEIGTYRSQQQYPSNQGYPEDPEYADNNIRHHFMPSLQDEELFTVSGDSVNINIIKLSFEFGQAIPDNILNNVQDILFVRERRDTANKKSLLSQGIFNRTTISGDLLETHSNPGYLKQNGKIDNINKNYTLIQTPFGFMNQIKIPEATDNYKFGVNVRGVAFPLDVASFAQGAVDGTADIGSGTGYEGGTKLDTEHVNNQGYFMSPESVLANGAFLTENDANGSSLEGVLLMSGGLNVFNYNPAAYRADKENQALELYDSLDTFIDYATKVNNNNLNPINIEDSIYMQSGRYRAQSKLDSSLPLLGSRWNQGGLVVKTTSDVPFGPALGGNYNIERTFYHYQDTGDRRTENRTIWGDSTTTYGGSGLPNSGNYIQIVGEGSQPIVSNSVWADYRKYLYNLKRNLDSQYGTIDSAEYILISRRSPRNPDNTFRTLYSNVYGGDTFITKFAVDQGELLPWYTPIKHGGDLRNDIYHNITGSGGVNSHPNRAYINPNSGPLDDDSNNANKAYGFDTRWGSYFFVESDLNTYYRHKDVNSEDQTTKYFPDETDNGPRLNSWAPWSGNIADYNTQYSKDNNVRKFYPVGSTSQIIDVFENRTIYSDQAANDDILDSYRSFGVNNFYDLPADTGPIWDSFVHANTLYLHTTKSLWRTFAEPAATLQGGNIDDIVLGTGNLFSRPSVQMLTAEGGYAGTISQFGGSHSQYGYVFPDTLQGKIFLLTTDNLSEISQDGLYTFFHKNLANGVDLTKINTLESHLIDNPYRGIGFTSGYDYKLKRIIMSQLNDNFTYSYFPGFKAWFRHSYIPNNVISFDNRTLMFKDGSLYEMNVGPKGNYFGTQYDSEIEYISNEQHNQIKTFTNIQLWTESSNGNVKIKDDWFKDILVSNDTNYSGVQTIVNGEGFDIPDIDGEVKIKLINDKYNISLPRSFTVDTLQNISDPNNLYTPIGNVSPSSIDDYLRERIKGDYAKIKLTYDNTDDYDFVLKYVITIFNINQR